MISCCVSFYQTVATPNLLVVRHEIAVHSVCLFFLGRGIRQDSVLQRRHISDWNVAPLFPVLRLKFQPGLGVVGGTGEFSLGDQEAGIGCLAQPDSGFRGHVLLIRVHGNWLFRLSTPQYAYPLFCAPFAVVGEGGPASAMLNSHGRCQLIWMPPGYLFHTSKADPLRKRN